MDVSPKKRVSPKAVLIGLGLLVAFSWCYARTFYEMWLRWFPGWRRAADPLWDRLFEGESYYTHGPLVWVVSILIAVLLIRFTRIESRPSRKLGALVLLGSLGVHWFAALARVNFLSAFTMLGVLSGGVLILWGRDALRRLSFPILFLVFMVPLPEVTIAKLNFQLKMFTVDGSVWLFTHLGGIAQRVGNEVLLLGEKSLVVANVCNGLRSLISLLAFGVLYAYVCKVRGGWRFVLLLASLPVALVCNAIRIMSLIVVADVFTPEAASGAYHDISGLLLYPLAIVILFSLERLILWGHALAKHPITVHPLFSGLRRTDEDLGQGHTMLAELVSSRAVVLMGALVVGAVLTSWIHSSAVVYSNSTQLNTLVPHTLVIDGRTWVGEDSELDKETLTILENPDYLRRRYVSTGRPPMEVMILFSRNNRKGIHPPDLCIEGSGQEIFSKQTCDLTLADGRVVPCLELLVQSRNRKQTLHLYTYRCGTTYTRSFWVQQGSIFLNAILDRDSRGMLIYVTAPHGRTMQATREQCQQLLRMVLVSLETNLASQPKATKKDSSK
jgi:exosortase